VRVTPSQTPDLELVTAQIAVALHDLCQPLTALACRLEIGQKQERALATTGEPGASAECLRQCERMNKIVITMRKLVQQAQAIQQGRKG